MLRRQAATLVQCRMRGVIGRRLAKERLFEVQTAAAKAFQMAWKWYYFRKSHALYKQRVDRAAANLQRVHRGNKGRAYAEKCRRERNAAVSIQTLMRKKLARMNYVETLDAASRVAAMYRARKGRERARLLRAERVEEEGARRKSEDEYVSSLGLKSIESATRYIAGGAGLELHRELSKLAYALRVRRDQELAKGSLGPKEHKTLELQDAFEMYDNDASGSIDEDEFQQILVELCISMAEAERHQALKDIDEDGSGEIELGEFQHWLAGSQADEAGGAFAMIFRAAFQARRLLMNLSGMTDSRKARYLILSNAKVAAMSSARRDFRAKDENSRPKFACAHCIATFAFSNELEQHTPMCEVRIGKEKHTPRHLIHRDIRAADREFCVFVSDMYSKKAAKGLEESKSKAKEEEKQRRLRDQNKPPPKKLFKHGRVVLEGEDEDSRVTGHVAKYLRYGHDLDDEGCELGSRERRECQCSERGPTQS